jgi:hypothetical protein
MKKRFVVITVIALALGACGDPAGPVGGDGLVGPASVYTTTINIVTYRLYISPPEGRVGDNYRLIVQREPGNSVATEKTSSGKITQGHPYYTLQPSFKGAPTFTVGVDSTRSIVSLSGLITFNDGTAEEGPGYSILLYADKNNVTSYTSHFWSEWSGMYAATCMATGWEARTCHSMLSNSSIPSHSVHHETRAVPIVPSAHKWGDWKVTTNGEETRICVYNPSHRETRVYAAAALISE